MPSRVQNLRKLRGLKNLDKGTAKLKSFGCCRKRKRPMTSGAARSKLISKRKRHAGDGSMGEVQTLSRARNVSAPTGSQLKRQLHPNNWCYLLEKRRIGARHNGVHHLRKWIVENRVIRPASVESIRGTVLRDGIRVGLELRLSKPSSLILIGTRLRLGNTKS